MNTIELIQKKAESKKLFISNNKEIIRAKNDQYFELLKPFIAEFDSVMAWIEKQSLPKKKDHFLFQNLIVESSYPDKAYSPFSIEIKASYGNMFPLGSGLIKLGFVEDKLTMWVVSEGNLVLIYEEGITVEQAFSTELAKLVDRFWDITGGLQNEYFSI